jgi:hypothetical protein
MNQDIVPFPEVVDSTMIAEFRACPWKFFTTYLQHWKTRNLSVHLHAGAAFARGLEVGRKAFWDQGFPEQEAIALGMGALLTAYGDFECPEDSPKSADRMAAAYEYSMSMYPMSQERMPPIRLGDKHAIEFSFVEPLDFLHPTTGQPVLYSGRYDQIVEYAGQPFGFDDKTTGSMGAAWPKQWDLRSQFTAYCWGARRAKIPVAGFIVRGTGILKTKFDTQQAITYRAEWQIEQWMETLLQDLRDMQTYWERGFWKRNLSESCNAYGGCGYKKVCQSQDPGPWLAVDFARRVWNPILREEREWVEV